MTTKERLREFAEKKGYGRNKFEEYVGIGSGYLSSKSKTITSDTIESVLEKFPDINLKWLLTGKGDMEISAISQGEEDKKDYYPQADILNQPSKPEISTYKLKTDYYGVGRQNIPLYEIEASAGLSTLFNSDVKQIPIDFITVPNAPRCDGAVFVRGDSMYPILKAGDIVCYKSIYNMDNIYYGEMYLIDIDVEGDQYLTFKYVQKSEKGDDYVCLVSHNTHHAPKDILKSDIKAIALVKLSIRYNTNS